MSVTTIKERELRRMKGEEGLVLQGCGGDLDEWVTGINDMLTEDGILLEGTRINDCKSFTHGSVTCLLFPFKDVKLDIGKLAMWRLKTHDQFGGTWLSDYVPNRLGGFLEDDKETEEAKRAYENVYLPEFAEGTDRVGQEPVCFAEFYANEWQDDEYRKYCMDKMNDGSGHKEKPDCPLIGADGNIFNLVGIASRTLKRNGLGDDAKGMTSRVFSSNSYEEALGIIGEYVNITGVGEEENMDGGMTPEM